MDLNNFQLALTNRERFIVEMEQRLEGSRKQALDRCNQGGYRKIMGKVAENETEQIHSLKEQRKLVPASVYNPEYSIEDVLNEFVW